MCTKEHSLEILKQAYFLCGDVLDGSVRDAYLYGSYARGDFHEASDVDILLTSAMSEEELSRYPLRQEIARVSSRLSLEHDVTVSITVKAVEQFSRFAKVLPYYENVLNEGIRYAG